MSIKVTFNDWITHDKFEEISDLLYESNMDVNDVIDYMREAWDARYETLTYHDL